MINEKKNIKNICDFRSSALMVNGSFVEWFAKLGESVETVEKLPSPRYIKTHLPLDLLPKQLLEKKPKVYYLLISNYAFTSGSLLVLISFFPPFFLFSSFICSHAQICFSIKNFFLVKKFV